jgi:hypothetical protein
MSGVRLYSTLLVALVIGISLVAGATAAPPPPPTIDSHPTDPSASDSATFEFHTDSAVSFWCQLDGGDFSLCGIGATGSSKYSDLKEGLRTFGVKAVDATLTESTVATYQWTVDKTPPPKPTIDLKPLDPSNDRSPTLRFSDSQPGVTFECRLDSGPFSDCSSPTTYNLSEAERRHTFRVRAVDGAKNRSDDTEYTWRIDLTPPPAPTITSGPANPTTATDATFAFGDSEAQVAFRCQIDGGAFSSCSSPAAYSGLVATAHVFSVRAADLAGNTGAVTSYGWTILAPPLVTTARDTTAPGDVRRLSRKVGYGILKLAWSRPPDADFSYVRVLVAKGSKAAKGGQPRTSVYKGTGTHYTNKRFKNGTYYRYAIISYDKAGNASRGVPVVVRPSVLLRSPRNGVLIHSPPRLVWAKVPKATFYNVQLFFRGRKILSAWPSAARLGLKRTWFYADRSFKLKQGTYVWYVWPGFGPRSKSRYGQLLGQSAFTFR